MAQIKQPNENITPIETHDSSLYRFRFGNLLFRSYTNRATSDSTTDFILENASALTTGGTGRAMVSINNSSVGNNNLSLIASGDKIEITEMNEFGIETGNTIILTVSSTSPVRDTVSYNSIDFTRIYVDGISATQANRPIEYRELTQDTIYKIEIKRGDAPDTNQVSVWTTPDGTIDSSLIRRGSTLEGGVNIDQTFTNDEKIKLASIESRAQENVKSNFLNTDPISNSYIENLPQFQIGKFGTGVNSNLRHRKALLTLRLHAMPNANLQTNRAFMFVSEIPDDFFNWFYQNNKTAMIQFRPVFTSYGGGQFTDRWFSLNMGSLDPDDTNSINSIDDIVDTLYRGLWSSTATYQIGDVVSTARRIVTGTGGTRFYRSIVSNNTADTSITGSASRIRSGNLANTNKWERLLDGGNFSTAAFNRTSEDNIIYQTGNQLNFIEVDDRWHYLRFGTGKGAKASDGFSDTNADMNTVNNPTGRLLYFGLVDKDRVSGRTNKERIEEGDHILCNIIYWSSGNIIRTSTTGFGISASQSPPPPERPAPTPPTGPTEPVEVTSLNKPIITGTARSRHTRITVSWEGNTGLASSHLLFYKPDGHNQWSTTSNNYFTAQPFTDYEIIVVDFLEISSGTLVSPLSDRVIWHYADNSLGVPPVLTPVAPPTVPTTPTAPIPPTTPTTPTDPTAPTTPPTTPTTPSTPRTPTPTPTPDPTGTRPTPPTAPATPPVFTPSQTANNLYMLGRDTDRVNVIDIRNGSLSQRGNSQFQLSGAPGGLYDIGVAVNDGTNVYAAVGRSLYRLNNARGITSGTPSATLINFGLGLEVPSSMTPIGNTDFNVRNIYGMANWSSSELIMYINFGEGTRTGLFSPREQRYNSLIIVNKQTGLARFGFILSNDASPFNQYNHTPLYMINNTLYAFSGSGLWQFSRSTLMNLFLSTPLLRGKLNIQRNIPALALTHLGRGVAGFGVNETNPRGATAKGGSLYMVGRSNKALYRVSTTGRAVRLGNADRFGINEGDPSGLYG